MQLLLEILAMRSIFTQRETIIWWWTMRKYPGNKFVDRDKEAEREQEARSSRITMTRRSESGGSYFPVASSPPWRLLMFHLGSFVFPLCACLSVRGGCNTTQLLLLLLGSCHLLPRKTKEQDERGSNDLLMTTRSL